jgi:hypothetical protein
MNPSQMRETPIYTQKTVHLYDSEEVIDFGGQWKITDQMEEPD